MTSWNKFCFTGGILEASVSLPGATNVVGLWPAIWSMGNLGGCLYIISPCFIIFIHFPGRAGYGASLEGMVSINYM